ncbi:MAG: hypothetical protein FJY97_06455 [candidate division Zixibacteria bacterium]|nr:hypothetical protein [candidate division Zixibacteria bacterium]
MTTTMHTIYRDALPDTFDALNALQQLRPIRDEADYEQVARLADGLAVLNQRSRDQEDYLETLNELISKYDETHYTRNLSHITSLDALKYLMECHDMALDQLARILQVDPVQVQNIFEKGG